MKAGDVKKIIAGALQTNPDRIDDEAVGAWDSLSHITVLVAIDRAFDGQVSKIQEMRGANSVAGIVKVLRENGLVK